MLLDTQHIFLFLSSSFRFGAVAVVGWFLLAFLSSSVFSHTRKVTGPVAARVTRLWYFWKIYRGDFEKTNVDIHRKYGKIVRVAPNEFSIDDPEAVRSIYGPGSKFRKADWYYGFGHPDTERFSLFTDRNSKRHASERKKFSNAYSMSSLVNYEQFIEDCVSIFHQRLEEFSAKDTTIDLGHWLQCFSFDVIGEVTFSKRFGFLDAGEDVGGIMASINNKFAYSTLIGIYPSLHPFMFKLLAYVRGNHATGEYNNLKFSQDNIAERKARFKQGGGGPSDFLTKFLESHAENPEKFTDYNVFMGCFSNIVAGSDTTSITLTAIMHNLCTNPHVLEKLRAEIDSMAESGDISDPVTFKEAQTMPYLQAVIKEGLRIHPATGLPLVRVVPEGGAMISGQFFPQETVVGINSWVAHRNTTVFGPDADTFNPERWFISDKAKLSQMERYFIPFGLGSRTCLGKNISQLEMSKLIPQLVRNFEFKLNDPQGKLEMYNMWFVKQKGFHCKVSARK